MSEKAEELKDHFGKFYQGYYLSRAILEDYANAIAKLEGIQPQEVKDRVELLRKSIVAIEQHGEQKK